MTDNELKTFDKILNLIIKQDASGKELMDELILLGKMKSAYINSLED